MTSRQSQNIEYIAHCTINWTHMRLGWALSTFQSHESVQTMATLDRGLIPESQHGNATTDEVDFEDRLSFALCHWENYNFHSQVQQREAGKHMSDGKD